MAFREEAQEDLAREAEHHHKAPQRALGASDAQLAEMGPVDLRLLSRQRAQAQIGFGCGRGRWQAMTGRK